MKNKIHTIEVENNETQSVEKIIEKIRENQIIYIKNKFYDCLLYTSPSPRDISGSRMPSSA